MARGRHVLGAPGGARTAHIVQFGPVGVERLGEEGLPESAEFGEGLCNAGSVGRGGKGCGSDRCHDAWPACFHRGFCRLGAFCRAGNEFWPDLLKEGFNCRDLAHTPYSRGERRGKVISI
jgi:hypothetical protein